MNNKLAVVSKEETVAQVTARIRKNIDEIGDDQAKQILYDMIEALIVLFVGAEPKLADPKIPVDEKIKPFFVAIGRLASEGVYAFTVQRFDKGPMMKFENKIAKFKNLESALTLLTK